MNELWVDHVSFSQLTSAEECPYGYFLLRIEGVEPESNAFAQAGTLAHEILADWANRKISIPEMQLAWIKRFPAEVTDALPPYLETKGYRSKLFESVLAYFEAFEGFPGYEVIGVEKKFSSSIAGVPFVGVIDLVLRDKKTGELTLVDHKSCSISSFRKARDRMYRQLLLYSKFCADEYGVFPAKLMFNLFREQKLDERLFDPEAFMAARMWAEDQINDMKTKDITDWFEVRPDYFRCTNLAGCRKACPYGQSENHIRKGKNDNKTELATAVG